MAKPREGEEWQPPLPSQKTQSLQLHVCSSTSSELVLLQIGGGVVGGDRVSRIHPFFLYSLSLSPSKPIRDQRAAKLPPKIPADSSNGTEQRNLKFLFGFGWLIPSCFLSQSLSLQHPLSRWLPSHPSNFKVN
ncbi:hypothetical protein DVH24_018185 [Malus domestica]|uniref:Uncharacterized protein n=1 Tax=Malus domestica TaxID=3750 RepID=A0A498KLD2_MALDO|nr:hypothetical protein DVH24_018185 [Malus domestica]